MDAHSEQKIRERAYQIWLEAGCSHGLELEHWAKAERDVANNFRPPAAGASAANPNAAKPSTANKPSTAKRSAPRKDVATSPLPTKTKPVETKTVDAKAKPATAKGGKGSKTTMGDEARGTLN